MSLPDFIVVIGVFHTSLSILALVLLLSGFVVALLLISKDGKTAHILVTILFMALMLVFIAYVPAKFYFRAVDGSISVKDQRSH